jgi:hypothetical protein
MSAWRVARIGIRALTLGVVAVSGVYLIVYLYRWEWNRALISGLFFLAALVTLSTSLILGALRSIEQRVGDLEGAVHSTRRDGTATRQVIQRANDDDARHRFDWLREPPQGFGVFVPVLIGTGVLLSGLTYLIERVAGLLASRTVDRTTARLLAPELPLGTRALDLADTARPSSRAAPTGGVSRLVGWGVVLALGSLLTVAAIDVIADATQSRDELPDRAATTSIDLSISQRGPDRPVETVALGLWTACEHTLRVDAEIIESSAIGGNRVRVVLDAGLGELARRRLFGCLEDATLDLVRASVAAYAVTPISGE